MDGKIGHMVGEHYIEWKWNSKFYATFPSYKISTIIKLQVFRLFTNAGCIEKLLQ